MRKLYLVQGGYEFGEQANMGSPLSAFGRQPEPAEMSNQRALSDIDFLQLQREQYKHDARNHQEIACLHKQDRLKHYGLHFAKYVGRLARGASEQKPLERTIVDTFLVSLSSSNALQQNLSCSNLRIEDYFKLNDVVGRLADAAGRYADACEKIDHLEDYGAIIRSANLDVVAWVVSMSKAIDMDLRQATIQRRQELALRHFYIED